MTRIAAVQMTSTDRVDDNLAAAERLISQAAADGARLVLLPENFAFIGRGEEDKLRHRERPGDGALQRFLGETAQRHDIWLVAGTVPVAGREPRKTLGRGLLFDPEGTRAAHYDKIHLFDVEVNGKERLSYRESRATEAGSEVVVVPTPLANIGLSVCYDLRFPELYRAMHRDGVQLICVPAAFTEPTGRAHWHFLLRARAVENLCYVLAANQDGRHADGRATYGHSLIVDPWGRILAEAEAGPGVVTADMELSGLQEMRERFPALNHRRLSL